MKYTVTIKDNESGDIVREVECNALIGGVSIDEETSAMIGVVHCSSGELLGACKTAKRAIYNALKDSPEGMILFTLFELKLMGDMKNELEKEDSENA